MQVILWFVDDCRMFAPLPSGGGVAHIIPEGDVFFWGHSGDQGGGTSMGKLCHHFPTFPFESGDVFQLFVPSTMLERNVTTFWLC